MRRSISMILGSVVLLFAVAASAAPNPAQKCAADKLRAAAKKAQGLLTCHASAVSKGQDVDPTCLQRAMTKFEGRFAKIEARGGCATVGDADAIESHVDSFVDVLVTALPPTTTTTTSCPPPTALYCGVNACPGAPFPPFCPSGQTCQTTAESCTCVGPPVPCGNVFEPLCHFGDCPGGLTCQSDTTSCFGCSCQ
jgi:hypothetical protein